MTIQDIRAKLADEVRYVEDVMADINERSAEDGSLTDEDTAAFAAGVAFREEGRAKLAVLEARSEALSARTAPVEGLNQINKPSERSVYDVSEIRYGAPAAEVRDRGVRAIDATRGLTDDQKTQAEHVMRSAEGDRDGSVARHIVATGNPVSFGVRQGSRWRSRHVEQRRACRCAGRSCRFADQQRWRIRRAVHPGHHDH